MAHVERTTRIGTARRALGWALLVLAGILIVAAFRFLGEREVGAEVAGAEPAHVEELAGGELSRVRLTEAAAERLDVRTEPVRRAGGATVVPYSALIYDPEGGTWVYTEEEPLAFVRAPVEVESIAGRRALLSTGPPVGTAVVAVGAAELFGAELGVDH